MGEGRFRADLWYRLDVFNIAVPPLRERPEDLPSLANELLGRLADKYQRAKPMVSPEDLARLRAYPFPGNVRELRNLLERSLLLNPPGATWLELDPAWRKRTQSVEANEPRARGEVPRGRALTPFEAQEYALIRQAMEAEQGGIRRAAARLRLSHQSLLRRLEKWPELRCEAMAR